MDYLLNQSLARIPGERSERWPDGARVDIVMQRHGVLFELYAPEGIDTQAPHTRDELYVIARGRAVFLHEAAEGRRVQEVSAGDALFVPAGDVHRFDSFSDDFATWAMFFGPEHAGSEHQ